MFGRPLRAGFRAAPLGGRGPIRTGSGSNLPLEPLLFAAIGDSTTSLNFNGGPFPWINGLLGAKLDMLANSGFNGRSLGQLVGDIANNYNTITSPGLEGLPALDLVAFRIGANDFRFGAAINSTHKANYVSVVTNLLARATRVVVLALTPVGGQEANRTTWNAYLRDELVPAFSISHPGRVFWIDDTADLIDGLGNVVTDFYLVDEVHQTDAGRRQMALTGLSQWEALIGHGEYISPLVTDSADVYPAQPQWVANPTNTGTGGTFGSGWSGTAPTGMHISGNGAGTGGVVSIVAADVGDPNQTPWTRIAPSASQAGSNISITLTGAGRTITTIDPETLEQLIDVRWTGFLNHAALVAWIQVSGGLKLTQVQTIGWLHDEVLTEEATLQQKFYRQNSAATGATTNYIYIAGGATASGAMGHIEFRCCSVRG